MADLKMNTQAVVSAANKIKSYNDKMRKEFPDVDKSVNKLRGTWDSPAADTAFTKFNEIKANYNNVRYDVLDNYVNFMLKQVGEGYTQTEKVNVSLADQFK